MSIEDKSDADRLMQGYAEGRWSSKRVERELNIDRADFTRLKRQYGLAESSPAPHYWSQERRERDHARQMQVAGMLFSGSPPTDLRWTVTAEDVRKLIVNPRRRTAMVAFEPGALVALHEAGRMDALEITGWETHIDDVILLASVRMLGFRKARGMMKALSASVVRHRDGCDGLKKMFRTSKNPDDWRSLLEAFLAWMPANLATRLQDDCEREIDTIFLVEDGRNGMHVNTDPRHFYIGVKELMKAQKK